MATWHYIWGCPLAIECNRNRRRGIGKKMMRFYGKTPEEAREKCANHLMLSSLHKKKEATAWRLARNQKMHTFIERDGTDLAEDDASDVEASDVDPMVDEETSAQAKPSSSASNTILTAKRHIRDAEEAARKAESIALDAAWAFGEVAANLQKAHRALDAFDEESEAT